MKAWLIKHMYPTILIGVVIVIYLFTGDSSTTTNGVGSTLVSMLKIGMMIPVLIVVTMIIIEKKLSFTWLAVLLPILLVGIGAISIPEFWERISSHWGHSATSVGSLAGLIALLKYSSSVPSKTLGGLALGGLCIFCGHQATEPIILEEQLPQATTVVNLAILESEVVAPELPTEPKISTEVIEQYELVIDKGEEENVPIKHLCQVSLKYVTPTEVRATRLSRTRVYRFTSGIPSKIDFGDDLVSLTFIGIGEGENKSRIGVRIKPTHHH
jgi:hypothetical protein